MPDTVTMLVAGTQTPDFSAEARQAPDTVTMLVAGTQTPDFSAEARRRRVPDTVTMLVAGTQTRDSSAEAVVLELSAHSMHAPHLMNQGCIC